MPLRDLSLVIRASSDGALDSANALTAALELEGMPLRGMALKVTCSSSTGTCPHLAVTVHASTTTTAPTSDSKIIGAWTLLHPASVGTYISYILPFVDVKARSIKVKLDMSGTTPISMDTCEVYLVPNVGGDWSRAVNFH